MAGKKGIMLELDSRTRIAAKVLWAGERTLGVRDAMFIAKFSSEEIENRSLQQRVRRAVHKLIPAALEAEHPTPPPPCDC
jgi:hypothetical protein